MKWNQRLLLLMLWLPAMSAVGTQAVETMLSSEDRAFILDVHNKERREVSPQASDMRKIVWDKQLEEVANRWVDACKYRAWAEERNFGANYHFVEYPRTPNETSRDEFVQTAVKHWVDSKKEFEYSTICGEACPYVQMITALIDKIGCAFKSCPSLESSEGQTLYFACFYSIPDANGFFPYQPGPSCSECPHKWNCLDQLCFEGNNSSKEDKLSIHETDSDDQDVRRQNQPLRQNQTSWQPQIDPRRHEGTTHKAPEQNSQQNRPLLSTRNSMQNQPNIRDPPELQDSLFKKVVKDPLPASHRSVLKSQMSKRHPSSSGEQIQEPEKLIFQDQLSNTMRDSSQDSRAFSPYENDLYYQDTMRYPYHAQNWIQGQHPATSAAYKGQYLSPAVHANNEVPYMSHVQRNDKGKYSSPIQGNHRKQYQSSLRGNYQGQYPSFTQDTYNGQYPPFMQGNYKRQYPSFMQGNYKGQYPSFAQDSYKGQYPSFMQGNYKEQYPTFIQGTYKGQYLSSAQGNYNGQYSPFVHDNYRGQYQSLKQSNYQGQYPSLVQSNYKGQYPSFVQNNFEEQYPSILPGTYRGQYPTFLQDKDRGQHSSLVQDNYKGMYSPLGQYRKQYPSPGQGSYIGLYSRLGQDDYRKLYPAIGQSNHKGYYPSFAHDTYKGQMLSVKSADKRQYPLLVQDNHRGQYPSVEQSNFKGQYPSITQGTYARQNLSSVQDNYKGQYPSVVPGNYRRQYPSFVKFKVEGQYPSMAQGTSTGGYPSFVHNQYKRQYTSLVQGNSETQNLSHLHDSYEGQFPPPLQDNYKRRYLSPVSRFYEGQIPSVSQRYYEYPSFPLIFGNYITGQFPLISQNPLRLQSIYNWQFPSFPLNHWKG